MWRHSYIARRLMQQKTVLLFAGLFISIVLVIYLSLPNLQSVARPPSKQGQNSAIGDGSKLFQTKDNRIVAQFHQYHVYLLILIITSPQNSQQRDTIRDTWLSNLSTDDKVYFVVGTGMLGEGEIKSLHYERSVHGDMLLLSNVNDSYVTLTKKVLVSLEWVDRYVSFRYLLKCDDDTFVNIDVLKKEMETKNQQRLYWGFFDGRARVKKSGPWTEKKWILCDTYLPYAKGGGYVLTADLVHFISSNANYLELFNSEDVSVGTWLAPLNIERLHDIRFDTEYISRGCSNKYIVTHKQSMEDMRQKYRNLVRTGKICDTEFQQRPSYIYDWNAIPSKCCIRSDNIQ